MHADNQQEDMALLKGLRMEDQRAFDRLFRKYYLLLCAYARRFLEQEDAEEVVQETMLQLWENRCELAIESSLGAYLFKAVRNRSLNLLAKKEIASRTEAVFYSKYQHLPDVEPYSIKELAGHIEQAIARLPEAYRTAFVMHRFKGLSYKEIADLCQVSPKTVNYRISQALKLLRVHLKDYLLVAGVVLQL